MRNTRVAIALVLAMVLAACGGDAGTTTTGDAGTTTTGDAGTTTTGGGSAETTAPSEGGNPFHEEVWTANGLPDFSTFDLTGEQILWADFGGPTHVDYRNVYLDDFAAMTGAEIIDASPFDYAQVRAQVESGNIQYDIITGVDYAIYADCGELYEEIPDTRFYRDLLQPEAVTSPCVVPHGTTVFMIYYNKELYADNPPTSCADFFDLANFPGSRGIWNSAVGIPFEIALLADGVTPEEMYPIDFDRAFAKWDTIRDSLDFFSPLGAGQEAIVNEEFDMLIMHSAAGLRVERAEGTIAYEPVWECAIAQIQSLGILKGTPRLDAATALSVYATQPEPQAKGMVVRSSASPLKPENVVIPDDLEDYMEKYLMTFHADQMPMLFQDTAFWAEHFDQAEEEFQQWQDG